VGFFSSKVAFIGFAKLKFGIFNRIFDYLVSVFYVSRQAQNSKRIVCSYEFFECTVLYTLFFVININCGMDNVFFSKIESSVGEGTGNEYVSWAFKIAYQKNVSFSGENINFKDIFFTKKVAAFFVGDMQKRVYLFFDCFKNCFCFYNKWLFGWRKGDIF